jgi:hypothetical protein
MLMSLFPRKREILRLFITCVFFINIWIIFHLLRVIPAYALYMRYQEIVSVSTYILAVGLIQSIAFMITLLVIAAILPSKYLRDRIVAKSATILLITVIWETSFRYLLPIAHNMISSLANLLKAIDSSIVLNQSLNWMIFLFFWVVSYFVIILFLIKQINHNKRLKAGINRSIEKIVVLATIYLLLDLISVLAIFVRSTV